MTAYTSHIIIDRVAKNEGIKFPTPEEALDQLKAEGYSRVRLVSDVAGPWVQLRHGRLSELQEPVQDDAWYFAHVLAGTAEQPDDVTETIKALATQFPKQGKHDAILIMAHGTPQVSNAYYSVIQAKIDELGYKNVYVYTVEGWPSLETVMPKLKANGIKNVTMMPMMMVADDHANNDMAIRTDSHNPSSKAGYTVTPYIHGIGENKAVQISKIERANDA